MSDLEKLRELKRPTNGNGNGLARLLHTTWGALVVLAAAVAAGSMATRWYVDFTSSPSPQIGANSDRISSLEEQVETLQEEMIDTERIQRWIICTTIPENLSAILDALDIRCPKGAETPPPEISQP